MDTHANAATSIFALQGFQIHGRPAKLSWGKDRSLNADNNRTSYDPYSSYNYATSGYGAQNWVQPGYDQSMRPAGAGFQASHGGADASGAAAVGNAAGWTQQQQQQQQYYQQYYSAGHNMNI